VEERSGQHPFLVDFYEDPARFAIETELAFMLIQLGGVKTVSASDGLVSDFAPAKNLIFARLQLPKEDVSLLEMVEARLWRTLPQPDVVVYLDVPLPVCLDRIAQRGRNYEQHLTINDLNRIKDGYRSSLQSLGDVVHELKLSGDESAEEVALRVISLVGMEPSKAQSD
jgi:deoxyadenosine/deoxycytidine kinase